MAHAANSAATLRDPAAHFDMVRCGVAIYGLDPFQEDPFAHGLEPALELSSYVAAVKRFEPGESAGYGRRWTADEPTMVATLPIGYGDGWRRALTNNCDVLIRGARRPLVGTVSMDNVTVARSATTSRSGDEAVLIGSQGDERILCEEVAERLGTINYEVTCGLSRAGEACLSSGWWAGRSAIACSGRESGDRDIAVDGDPERAAREFAAAEGGPVFQLSEAFGAWRALEPRPLRHPRLLRASGRDDRGGPRPARLHDQRDGRAAGRRAT